MFRPIYSTHFHDLPKMGNKIKTNKIRGSIIHKNMFCAQTCTYT